MAVLNIFTDASTLDLNNKVTLGCPGFVTADGWNVIDRGYTVLARTTNNASEATAVLLGVHNAIKHRYQYDTINIISDSQWCINSLTKWIFNWVNTKDQNGVMYNSSSLPVGNQEIIEQIIMTIVQAGIKINFFHCKGHVVTDSRKSTKNASDVFKTSNGIGVDEDTIKYLAYFNNDVDNMTRQILKDANNANQDKKAQPLRFEFSKEYVRAYKNLIGG